MRLRLATIAVTLAAVLTGSAALQDPIDRIREADLKRDLFALAGDAMRGREGGTLDEMTASAWVAERAREAGLQPAGDNGTYFQNMSVSGIRMVQPAFRARSKAASTSLTYRNTAPVASPAFFGAL